MTRTTNTIVTFLHPFFLKGIDRALPPDDYQVVTDEESIEGLSFLAYRRVSTMILVPGQSHRAASIEMIPIDPADLRAAQERDRAMLKAPEADASRPTGA